MRSRVTPNCAPTSSRVFGPGRLQPKAHGQNFVLPPIERGQNFPHQLGVVFLDEPVKRRRRIGVGHDFRNTFRLVVTYRSVQ